MKKENNIDVNGDVKNANFLIGDNNSQTINNIFNQTINYIFPNSNIRKRTELLNLCKKVRRDWIDNVLNRETNKDLWIELDKRLEPKQLHQSSDKPQLLTENITNIFLKYNSLLILGEAGAGKTMTLLSLARDLLDSAEKNKTAAVPVIFHLSTYKHKSLSQWLIEEFKDKYLKNKNLVQEWLDNRQIILLLDDLDEVQPQYQQSCVKAINEFVLQYGIDVVVCSRTTEYQTLSQRLNLECAIRLKSLTQSQIQIYLNQARGKLSGLQTLLQQDESLKKLARSPLMLNLMTNVYKNLSPKQIFEQNSKQIENQLIEKYIKKVLNRKEQSKLYSNKEIQNKLSLLAYRMQVHGESLHKVNTWTYSLIYIATMSVFFAIMLTLIFSIFLAWVNPRFFQPDVLIEILTMSFAFGSVVGIVAAITDMFYFKSFEAFEYKNWSWSTFKQHWCLSLSKYLSLGLVISVIYSLVLYVLPPFLFTQPFDFKITWIILGSVGGIATGLIHAGINYHITDYQTLPFSNIKLGLIWGIVFGLSTSSIIYFVGINAFGFIENLLLWISIGVFSYTGFFILKFYILRFFISFSPIFEYCTEIGLLRRAGSGYLFTHRLVLEYFAQKYYEK